jgi:hypothetical protein
VTNSQDHNSVGIADSEGKGIARAPRRNHNNETTGDGSHASARRIQELIKFH